MENYEILWIAIKDFPTSLKSSKPSTFGFFHSCIKDIIRTENEESRQKEKLLQFLQELWNIDEMYLTGCKVEEIQRVAELIFGTGIKGGMITKVSIKNFKFDELYLYYCYMERMTKSHDTFRIRLLQEERERISKKQKIKEENRQREEEAKISKMTRKELLQYEISNGDDMKLYQDLADAGDEKTLIAGLLKEYWIQQGKWEGSKVSKKQKIKIENIKAILNS